MLRSLYSVHDEDKPFELELAWICDASGREFQRVPADISAAAEQAAKSALEESDMCVLSAAESLRAGYFCTAHFVCDKTPSEAYCCA